MIDINSILTQALAAAVAEATKPLVERIAALETRLLTLENNPAQGVDTTLETRVAALEKHTAVLDPHGGILEYLDNQEWFWEKVRRFAAAAADAEAEAHMQEHLEQTSHYDEDAINNLIDAADEASSVDRGGRRLVQGGLWVPVSYTHLTLPTKLEV